jgi:hypothetical protein
MDIENDIVEGMHVRTADGELLGAITRRTGESWTVEHPNAGVGQLARCEVRRDQLARVSDGQVWLTVTLDELSPSAPDNLGDIGERQRRRETGDEGPPEAERLHHVRSAADRGVGEGGESGVVVGGASPRRGPSTAVAGQDDPRPREEAIPSRNEQRKTR